MDSEDKFFWTGFSLTIIFYIISISGYITHIVWSINKLLGDAVMTSGQIIVVCLGVLAPPLGAIHGVMIWFGSGF